MDHWALFLFAFAAVVIHAWLCRREDPHWYLGCIVPLLYGGAVAGMFLGDEGFGQRPEPGEGGEQHQHSAEHQHPPHPDLHPAQQGAVEGVQGLAHLRRVAHGVHRLDHRLGVGNAPALPGLYGVLQVSSELRRDGGVVGGKADEAAHRRAVVGDGHSLLL